MNLISLSSLHKIREDFLKTLELSVNEDGEVQDEELLGLAASLKEEGIELSAKSFIAVSELSDMVASEIKRLTEIKNRYETYKENLKKILTKLVPEGEKYDFGTVKVSWRKSEVVEVDDFDFNIDKVEKEFPELVKVTKELKKTEVKKALKEKGILPEGVIIKEKMNIQIK